MRKLVLFALPFAVAVGVAVYLLPDAFLIPAAALCALGGLLGFLWEGDRRLKTIILAVGLSAGFLWTCAYGQLFRAPAQALDGQQIQVTATVTDWPAPFEGGSYLTVQIHRARGLGINATLFLRKESDGLTPGDVLQFTGRFRLTQSAYLGGDGSRQAKGIFLTAGVIGKLNVISNDKIPIRYYPAAMARAMKASVADCFDPQTAPLITALLTGEKTGLDSGVYASFQRTGIAHVVAVSGMHVSFLAGVLTTLLKKGRRGAICVVGFLFFFAAAVGGTPSVLRAAFLQSMLLLAPLLGREDDKPTTLATALFLLLLGNPFAIASISLQLSFAAVAGIYLITEPLYKAWTAYLPHEPQGWWAKLGCKAACFVLSALATTLGAMVLTTPLTTLYFRTFSLISPLANLFILWAVSLTFLGGLAIALVGLLSTGLGQVLALLPALPAQYILWLTSKLATLPFAAVSTSSPYLRLWLVLAYGVAVLYLIRGRMQRPWIPLCAGCITLCTALVLTSLTVATGDVTVSVLDVGQGQSVAITSQGRTTLVDCGGNSQTSAGTVAADYIQSMGTSYLDVLVLTHYHADHANGVTGLLSRLKVGLVILPDVGLEDPLRAEITAAAATAGVRVEFLRENAQMSLGAAELRLYAPLGDGGANEEGLSVLCTSGDFAALLTGDMNTAIEQRLLKYGALPPLTLYVAGHHGSKYASSQTLLEATRPEYTVISVGENSYGQPAPETLERLNEAGCYIYRTDLMGTVTITYGE